MSVRLTRTMLLPIFAVLALTLTPIALGTAAAQNRRADSASPPGAPKLVDRGRYLAKIAGCNDCHTPGYAMKEGKVPEAEWLTGDAFGWRGPWGTTYAVNLRLYMQSLSEDQWLEKATTLKTRPPMPWYTLNEMRPNDLRALYRYIKSLGPAGAPAPAYLPPGKEPKPPFATFPSPKK